MARTDAIQLFDHLPPEVNPLAAREITLPDDDGPVSMETEPGGVKTLKVELPDGSIVIDFNPQPPSDSDGDFYDNLANKISEGELSRISSELIGAIDADEQSRSQWLQTRTKAMDLLGLKLEDPRSDVGMGAEGASVSTIRDPLLLETTLRFQATARGELLPAGGPVKVRNDAPPAPDLPPGRAPPSQQNEQELLAEALEKDFNHYLTVDAPEYVPDTDRMLFYIGWGGLGVKKVYNCPLRRRPVSESVDAKDFIVSDATTDLRSAGRITHRIWMRPSTLKRMQIVGAYRDVPLSMGYEPNTNPVDKKVDEIQGVQQQSNPPIQEDQLQEIYESYCELDIVGYEHKDEKDKITGLRCPYKVTIHKASRQVLEVRRNWDEDDELCNAREYFVDFPFAPGLGFYPIGLMHIIGNMTRALTAAQREILDAGMFASFPGFLVSKAASRQLTNQFRVPPGGAIPLDVGAGRLQDAVMPIPYKDVSAGFMQFIEFLIQRGQAVAGAPDIQVGEGNADVPVGTTLAMIEQATKIMDAVHKRLHASQAREFGLLKERFKEDPEAFWRFNKRPSKQWEKQQFLTALDNNQIIPVADPNNPTSLHRIAKAVAIKQLQQAAPDLYDPMAVDKRIFRIVGIDPEGLFLSKQAPPAPDPKMAAVEAKREGQQAQAMGQLALAQIKAQEVAQQSQDKAADRASKERLAQLDLQLKNLDLQREWIIHQAEFAQNAQMDQQKHQQELQLRQQEGQRKQMEGVQKMRQQQTDAAVNLQDQRIRTATDIQAQREKQAMQMGLEREKTVGQAQIDQARQAQQLQSQQQQHEQTIRHTEESHAAELEHKKAMTKAVRAAKPAKPKTKG